jgi:hypothetical protein
MRKLILAAAALASLAPVAASAQPGYGRGGYGYNNGGYEQNYGYGRNDRVRECFRSLRYVRNRWELERRRDHCQRLAERMRGRGYGYGYGHRDDDDRRGRGW